MRNSLFLLFVLGALALQAQAPANYYTTAQGLSGAPLRQALHQIIDDHKIIPYANSSFDTSDALRILDRDPANPANVWLLYAQRSEPTNTFGAATGWNREHQWPNSYGLDGVQPAYSDLHNLRAEDVTVNSTRANEYYDISTPTDPGYQNPAHPESPLCSSDSDSWEPPASVKGDIARSMFYMATRYIGDAANEPALYITDAVGQISSTTNLMGRLSTLLQWHRQDPVSAAEQTRNNLIYSLYQTNRNPFVDHPDWVDLTFAPPHTNAPRLEILSAQPFTVAWLATNHNPFTLRAQIPPGTTWQTLSNLSLVLTNGQWRATISNPASASIYRLQSTP